MKLIRDIETLNGLLQKYFLRNTTTNNYVLSDAYKKHIANQCLFYVTTDHNACILVKKFDYYQLFYYINDHNELMINDLNNAVFMEILYRGEDQRPAEIISYWEKCDFKQHLTRNILIANKEQLSFKSGIASNIKIKYAETEKEIIFTKELIENSFDKYTGDILTFNEVKFFAEKRNIICAYLDGNLGGILQFEIKNNIIWLGHIAVSQKYRGFGIATALVKAYITDNDLHPNGRYQLWVIKDNVTAYALYKKFGFVYGNKSSASMLKNKQTKQS